jgi:hypothetical protein
VYCLVGFIDRLRGKDPSYIEFKRAERIAVQTNENQNSGAEEYLELTNRAGFLITDQIAIGLLMDNKNGIRDLQSLVPVLSPTNSVIKLSPYQADLKRLRLENHFALLKLCMSPEVYEANGLEVLEGYRLYAHDRVSGAEEGWIGHIATESTRVHRFEEGKKK